jgi:hypothetical protein
MMSRVRGNTPHDVVLARHVLKPEARHNQASLDQVHMGVDEGRSDKPATKIKFGLPRRRLSCRIIAAHEADRASVGYDRSRARVLRRVDASPDEDHELVRRDEVGSDLRAVLERNREHRRGVGGHFSRSSDTRQCGF